MSRFDQPVAVTVAGFEVTAPSLDPAELRQVAHEIRSDIGGRLASLGLSCTHGGVSLTVGGVEANTDDTDDGEGGA